MRKVQPRRRLLAALSIALGVMLVANVLFSSGEPADATVDVTLDELETLDAEDRPPEAEIRGDADIADGTLAPQANGAETIPRGPP